LVGFKILWLGFYEAVSAEIYGQNLIWWIMS
jgi:hypothetical protein